MSDGCSDEARSQDRYFDALRARLIAEDLLYGEYDPGTCPNLQMTEDPFCVADGRLLGECGLMWCQPCHTFFGPWGAWRAVVIDILHRVAYEEGKIGYESWWPSVAIIRTELAAVGWSP